MKLRHLMTANSMLSNPYIAGRPLAQDQGFTGREDIIQLVEGELRSPDRNAVVLSGARRIGKTSLLLQLQRRLPENLYCSVYFDLMDRAHRPLVRVLFDLAAALASQAGMPQPDVAVFDEEGIFLRREFLPQLYAQLGEIRRPVVLVDEFDARNEGEERRLPPGAAGRVLMSYLGRLIEGEPRLAFVFAAGRKTEENVPEVQAVFKSARHKRLSPLDERSARELVRMAEREGTLAFSDEAVDRILQSASGHPYFTQLLCQLLWDAAHSRERDGIPRVDVADLDAALTQALEAGEHMFGWVWDGLRPAEKVVYAAVAHALETNPVVKTADITQILQRHGIRIVSREIEFAPDSLVEWDMLRRQGDAYSFPVEVMRRWLVLRKPLPRLKDELERIVPLADTLYQSGDGFYRRGNLDSSQQLLRQALTVNPQHLNARLLLGQVLSEQGKAEEAIREFEESFRHDESVARAPLVRALLARSEELQREGVEDQALAACERVLEIAPREKQAVERRREIWLRRGDEALRQDRFEEAVEAYQQIADAARLAQVDARKKRLECDKLAALAQTSMQSERWDVAITAYQDLIALEPEVKNWKEELERARVEQKWAKSYSEAEEAVAACNWSRAQKLLLELLQAKPEYKEAPQLLARAYRVAPPKAERKFVQAYSAVLVKAAVVVFFLLATGLFSSQQGASPLAYYATVGLKLALGLLLVEGIAYWIGHRKPLGITGPQLKPANAPK